MQGKTGSDVELSDAASLVGHLVPERSVFALLAAERLRLFPEAMFSDLFPSRIGRPSVPAEVIASVLVLQALTGASDREAVEELRTNLKWKVATGLPIGHEGFHPTTLTLWRRRLAASTEPDRVFDAVKDVVHQTKVLSGKDMRALDSTVLLDSVATQDTVTQLVAAVRRVIRDVPGAQAVAAEFCSAHDYALPGKPKIAWEDKEARAVLVDALVGDAVRLLAHLPQVEMGPGAADAVALLALVSGQDVEPVQGSDGTDGRWQVRRGTAADRVISTVDDQARHAHKSVARKVDGFKAHIAVEPTTGIYTAVSLTKAGGAGWDGLPVSDASEAIGLLAGEAGPVTVLGDSAYGSGKVREQLLAAGHRDVVKPAPLRPAVKGITGAFTYDDFTVTHQTLPDGTVRPVQVTCPAGTTRQVTPSGGVTFGVACNGCPLRERCTRSRTGRSYKVSEHDRLQRAARIRAATDEQWRQDYRTYRPMVERGISWLVADNSRRVRYRGVIKNDHWISLRAAALNLRRLMNLGLTVTDGTWALT